VKELPISFVTDLRTPAVVLQCVVVALTLQSPVASGGEPLLELPVCSTARLLQSPRTAPPAECQPDRAHKRIRLELTAQTSAVVVGGYRVTTDNYNARYIAPVLEARPGDDLLIRLNDQLAPKTASFPLVMTAAHTGPVMSSAVSSSLTNLHTHGLIVSPQNPEGVVGYGDDPYLQLDSRCVGAGGCPASSADYRIRIPARLPADVYGNRPGAPHPSGLFWYHPHIHGLAQHQVSGGMAGLISVGDPRESLRDGNVPLADRIDVRYLALKDLQVESSQAPEAVSSRTAGSAAWHDEDFDTQYCGSITLADTRAAVLGPGYCRPADAQRRDHLWLFTVNG
jgi:FtsP/CotA-like multicopper oxidase with cupredoxin domain